MKRETPSASGRWRTSPRESAYHSPGRSSAAREVTGSCHILRVDGKTVLLDCGMFQGHRAESHEKNLRLPCPPEEIDAVVLSHAHIDHSGRLPFLARHGYQGPVYVDPACRFGGTSFD